MRPIIKKDPMRAMAKKYGVPMVEVERIWFMMGLKDMGELEKLVAVKVRNA
jgi:hypothetical protein